MRRELRIGATLFVGVLQAASPVAQEPTAGANYVVGPQDVLTITSYDQPELTGKFTIEADGSFTYPLIGRVQVGGMTLRATEGLLREDLVSKGFFKDPQVSVSVEQYRSQKIYIVGEVRTPGAYPLSGDMRLVEALALAGSTTPMASSDIVIVHAAAPGLLVEAAPSNDDAGTDAATRVDLNALQNGDVSQNVRLASGDTVFVLRAENVYVFGQVKSPGAYPLRQKKTSVLQALSLAGGTTQRASTNRIQIVRTVDGIKKEFRAGLSDFVLPRDTIVVPERFF